MSLLVETIKFHKGIIHNINYHNERFNRSRKLIYNIDDYIDLRDILTIKNNILFSICKLRVIYGKFIEKIELLPYEFKKVKSLKIIENDQIDYSFKYENRSMFDNLLAKKENCDDILIINNGRVTDTSYCNVVFSDGEKFLTSSTPLLRGTKREKLIREKIIKEEEITLKDLRLFKKAILINAMIDIDDNIEVSTENII